MRVFLALDLPPDIKEYLGLVAKRMSQRVGGVKWVSAAAQHITLKFFGEIDEKRVEEIQDALQGIEASYQPVMARIKEISAFPDTRRPRVIIITFQEGVDNMKAIFHDIESRLLSIGIEKETRGYTPHITLGRIKAPAPLLDRDRISLEDRRFLIGNLVLFQSILRTDGALYTPLKEIQLGRVV